MNGTKWHERGRRVALTMLAVALIVLVVFFCPAQLLRSGFEPSEEPAWEGPFGGGAYGGSGGGRLVEGSLGDFVRTGGRSVRLEVWDDGSDQSVAWAGITQTLPCELRRKVQAGVWLYFSSTNLPLRPCASAHVRVEYFKDAEGQELIPECVYVSPPLSPDTHASDTWHLMEVTGRIPAESRSLRVSVVVMGQEMRGQTQAIWIDDLFVEMQPTPSPGRNRRPGRAAMPVTPQYVQCSGR